MTAQNRNDKQMQKQMTKKGETNAKNGKIKILIFQCLQAQDFPKSDDVLDLWADEDSLHFLDVPEDLWS